MRQSGYLLVFFAFCIWSTISAAEYRVGQEFDCPSDLSGNGKIDFEDLDTLLDAWGDSRDGDIDGDTQTSMSDLNLLLGRWGQVLPHCEVKLAPRFRIKSELLDSPHEEIIGLLDGDGRVSNTISASGERTILIQHPIDPTHPEEYQSAESRREEIDLHQLIPDGIELTATAIHPSGLVGGFARTLAAPEVSSAVVIAPSRIFGGAPFGPSPSIALDVEFMEGFCVNAFAAHDIPFTTSIEYFSSHSVDYWNPFYGSNPTMVGRVSYTIPEYSSSEPSCPTDWELKWALNASSLRFELLSAVPLNAFPAPSSEFLGIDLNEWEIRFGQIPSQSPEGAPVITIGVNEAGHFVPFEYVSVSSIQEFSEEHVLNFLPPLEFMNSGSILLNSYVEQAGPYGYRSILAPAWIHVRSEPYAGFALEHRSIDVLPHLFGALYLDPEEARLKAILSNRSGDFISSLVYREDPYHETERKVLVNFGDDQYELPSLVSVGYEYSFGDEETEDLLRTAEYLLMSDGREVLVKYTQLNPPFYGPESEYSRLVPTCPSDLNGDGACDQFDTQEFVWMYEHGALPDLANDGVINARDKLAFERAHFAP